jgi:hypothetical protein
VGYGGGFASIDTGTFGVTCVHEDEMQTNQSVLSKGFISQGGLTWMPATFQKTWHEANTYCIGTPVNGQIGWRLPSKDELVSLYESGVAMKAKEFSMFFAWSSTPNGSDEHYTVFLYSGEVKSFIDQDSNYVPCVHSN